MRDMHKVLFPLSLGLLLVIGIWAALLFTRSPQPFTTPAANLPVTEEPTQTNVDEDVLSETTTPEPVPAEVSTEAIPELNPAEKTNPFSGTYKNPFAN